MSENPVDWRNKTKSLFVPLDDDAAKSFKEMIPIFMMITFVMVGLYALNISVGAVDYSTFRLSLLTILFLIHLLLYWMILSLARTEKHAVRYLVFQGILVFAIVLVSGNVTLSLGLFSSISGTAVGTLSNKRLAISGVIFYIFLAIANVLILSNFTMLGELLPIFLGAVLFAAFFAYLFNRQVVARDQAQQLLSDLENAHQQLSEYALEVESLTLTNERQRMARELHDTLAQGLAGLILQLEAADSHLGYERSEKAQEIIQQAMGRARTTLADARHAIDDLRDTESTPDDLVGSIQEEAERFSHTTGIHCQLQLCKPDGLSPQAAETTLRAVSEGLMNIARHAQANEVRVDMQSADQFLRVKIWDNGIGFDARMAVGQSGHYGLLGMRERTRILGGSLLIESDSSRGTTLKLEIPLSEVR
jgi:two-component system, NarL family, sensor histidine kinase YdfH